MFYAGKKIRLSAHDLCTLKNIFQKYFLKGDGLWIFGSRTLLNKRGGDIDLYIESNADTADHAIAMQARFLSDLEQKIGEQKIDIVMNLLNSNYQLPIYDIAKTEGVKIA